MFVRAIFTSENNWAAYFLVLSRSNVLWALGEKLELFFKG
jgi:hypothetical protein